MNCIPSTSYNPSHSTLAGSNQAVQHPITALFNEIPWSHQCSILNCLLFTASCDESNNEKELAYMNSLVNVIIASANDAADYFQLYGKERMEHDIANLTKSQKQFLIVAMFELARVDGRLNEQEALWIEHKCNRIGFTPHQAFEIFEKTTKLFERFASAS